MGVGTITWLSPILSEAIDLIFFHFGLEEERKPNKMSLWRKGRWPVPHFVKYPLVGCWTLCSPALEPIRRQKQFTALKKSGQPPSCPYNRFLA